ncbi:spidroin-2-like [Suricata suricatta]|uniref:spidroin-2-like n=1 Tax=Suricata suricatta TaxID=37032 RepID=UPI001155E796|nr:spidroin-2-like [Suricata suricatta]
MSLRKRSQECKGREAGPEAVGRPRRPRGGYGLDRETRDDGSWAWRPPRGPLGRREPELGPTDRPELKAGAAGAGPDPGRADRKPEGSAPRPAHPGGDGTAAAAALGARRGPGPWDKSGPGLESCVVLSMLKEDGWSRHGRARGGPPPMCPPWQHTKDLPRVAHVKECSPAYVSVCREVSSFH